MVRILRPDGVPVGAGVLVGQRHVITAAHNISPEFGAPKIDFPLVAPGHHISTVIESTFPHQRHMASDLCGLRLLEAPPQDVLPAPVTLEESRFSERVQLYGVPPARDAGFWVEARCRGRTAGALLQLEVPDGAPIGILPGYSGGPLWSSSRRAVLGIVLSSERDLDWRSGYALPMAEAFRLWPELHDIARSPSPYRGLGVFDEGDRQFYHGRGPESERLSARVRARPATLVVANPGLGKSSLVRAGVVPLLREHGHRIAYLDTGFGGLSVNQRIADAMAPLMAPDDAATLVKSIDAGQLGMILADATRNQPLVLVVDQLEELIAQDPSAANELFERVLPAARTHLSGRYQLRVLACLRLDFLGQAGASLPAEISEEPFNLAPLGAKGLRDAITNPAELSGHIRFTPDAVDRIIADAHDATNGNPGELLPMIEFTVTQLWEQATRSSITPEDYHALNGVAGALVRVADGAVDQLDPSAQCLAPRLLTRLVRVGEVPTQDTRATVALADLPDAHEPVVQRLASTRLVVIGENGDGKPTVRLAHDALLTRWGRLRQWIEEDRDFRRWQLEITSQRLRWQENEDSGALLRGGALAAAERWADERDEDLLPAERAFIQESRADAGRERRKTRRKRWIYAGATLLLAVVVMASTVFVPRLMDSVAGDLLATAGEQRGKDEATSLVLIAAAQSASTRPDTVRALLAAELDNHGVTAILPTSTPATELGLAADGKRVVVLEKDQRLVVWDVGSSPPTMVVVEGGISAVAVSQAGDQVVTGDRRGRIQLHDAASWAVLAAWDAPESTDATAREVEALSFDATGQRIAAAATNSGRVRLWEIATGKSRDRVLRDTYVTVNRMGFTADGVLITEGFGTYFGWLAWDPAKDTVSEIRNDDSLPRSDDESMLFGPRTVLARCDGLKLGLLEPVTRQPVPQFSSGMPCGTHRVSLAGLRLLQVEVPVDGGLKPQQPKLLVSDGSAYWTSVPGRERPPPPGLTTAPVGGPYALSATANVLASYDSLSVRVTRLPDHKQGGANVRFAQFIGDGSLLALREDGELNRFDTDGDVVATQRLPFSTTANFNVTPDGSRLAVAGVDDRDSEYKIRRFTLPELEPVGTEIVVPGAGLEDNRDIDVTTLDDGRLVVRTGRQLVVYPRQADTGQSQVINLSGASETPRMIVSARPGTHQVALPTPDGSGMQLIDVDTKQIGTAYGPFPGGLTEGILFDGPDTAVVLTSTSAINLDLSNGTVERPEGRPILGELSRDSANGAQVLHGWPTVLKKWGFAEDSRRIWDDTPVDGQWVKPPKVVLSSDGSRMAVVRDDLIDIVPTDPSEWQTSVCAMTSAAHDRARTHMGAPWLLDPC